VKIVWFTGPCPLARVDVDETPERVTVTIWEEYPPAFAQGGERYGILAIGMTHCVDVPLRAPLGEREVVDGKTGRPPDEIDDFDYITHNHRADVMALDLDALECLPIP
jgi:hypothetical protein